MDSTVIQEIANQLGMAVDQAGQFISDNLPQFAGLKAMQASVPLAVMWGVFAICAIVSVVSIIVCIVSRKKSIKDDKENNISTYYSEDWNHYTSFTVFIVSDIFGAFFFIVAIFASIVLVPDIIGWSNYPQAMLMDMAIQAVG